MKWLLIGWVGVVCFTGMAWSSAAQAEGAGEFYQKANDQIVANDYAGAIQTFEKILTNFPGLANPEEVEIRLGYCYLHTGDYAQAISHLSRLTDKRVKPSLRGVALFYTALAQFSQVAKLTDKKQKQAMLASETATLSDLIDTITATPTPEISGYLEDAYYYRAMAQYQQEHFAETEKDLLQLLQQFGASLQRPDYLLRLAALYAEEAGRARDVKKPTEETNAQLRSFAQKAFDRFDQASKDPNALVQANAANMSKAEVLYGLLAPLDLPDTTGFQKALDTYRLVKRKDDVIALQQKRLEELKASSAAQLRNGDMGAAIANANGRIIEREEGRLKDMTNATDPIVSALIRIGECYNQLRQADEARTVLHRLAQASLTPEQQQEVDFQLLYSYALGGQTEKANKALDSYLSKHSADPQADSISYQMAGNLIQRKDYSGALIQADRSLQDFPKGRFVADVVSLKAQALLGLGKTDESKRVINDYLSQNPQSPAADALLLTKALNETAVSDFNEALVDYSKVRNNASASQDLQVNGAAGYIKTLQAMKRYDEVINESKAFTAKFPTSDMVPRILVMGAEAMDQKHDPAAVAAFQDIARKYPKDESAPYALFYIVTIYQHANKLPEMIQAADDLRKAFPTAYAFLTPAAEIVSAAYIKQKKFDEAIALYQPLASATQRDIAAMARNKVGNFALQKAKTMSPPRKDEDKVEAEKRLGLAEQSYLSTLKDYPDQLEAVGEAFQGLIDGVLQRRTWGMLTDADLDGYLGKITAGLTSPEIQARVEMARAGLVLVEKDGAKQYAAALDRFKKAMAPGLSLTRQEANQYGELLIAMKQYPAALDIFNQLLSQVDPKDQRGLADAYYGLGSTYLAQGDTARMRQYFIKIRALSGGAAWYSHTLDVDYGLALSAAESGDFKTAKDLYASLLRSQQVSDTLRARAMIGYGQVLEKSGNGITPVAPGTIEFAVHYYQQVHAFYGPALPDLSAEALFDAGMVYKRANDRVNARKQFNDLIQAYGKTAPDWAAKAKAEMDKLPQ